MIPDSHVDLLTSDGFAAFASIGPDGAPQSKPLWYDWDGSRLKVSTIKTRQNYRNVVRNNHVALSIQDPANPYRYLEIRGVVERIEDDPDYAFINSLAKKYMGVDTYPMTQPGDERVVLFVAPERTTTMG